MRKMKAVRDVMSWVICFMVLFSMFFTVSNLWGAGEVTKGLVGMQDLSMWDGVTDTFTRKTSSGYNQTLNKYNPGYVDALNVYGGGKARNRTTIMSALGAIGTTNKVTIFLAPGTWSIAANMDMSAYKNVTFEIPAGAVLSHSTYVITFGAEYEAGRYKIFDGSGKVYTKNADVYVEQYGAVADGELVTDDYAAIQGALDGATTGANVHIKGGVTSSTCYWIDTGMLDVSDVTSRRLTILGEGVIRSSTTGTAFRIMSRSTTMKDITVEAVTGNERQNVNQVGILLANQTGGYYDHVTAKNFYTNFKLWVYSAGQAPTWFETTKFFALYSTGGHYGYYIGTDKTKWQSFATLEFYGCACDVDATETDGVGVYIGENVDLYRGYMDISVHPKGTNSKGFYYEGTTHGFTGRWMGECHAGQNPGNSGQTGIFIGTNAKRLYGEIEADWMSCDTPYVREDAGTIKPQGIYLNDNKGRTSIVWDDLDSVITSAVGAGFYDIGTQIVIGATAGTETAIETSSAHGMFVGDTVVIYGVDSDNPFNDAMDWQSTTVTATPDDTHFSVEIDTSSVTSAWKVGDTASVRRNNIKLVHKIEHVGTQDYVTWEASGGRFSFKQRNKRELSDGSFSNSFLNNVFGVLATNCDYSSKVALNEAEPDVSGIGCLILDNTVPTTITDFAADAYGNPMGRFLVVIHAQNNDNTGMTNSATFQLLYQQDVVGQGGMMQIFMQYDEDSEYPADQEADWRWHEIARFYRNHVKNTWNYVPDHPQVGQLFICTNCTDCRGDDGGTGDYPIWWSGTAWLCANGLVENGP